jgi:hypothetical protein
MSIDRITELTEATTIEDNDIGVIVDTSTDTTKKYLMSVLRSFIVTQTAVLDRIPILFPGKFCPSGNPTFDSFTSNLSRFLQIVRIFSSSATDIEIDIVNNTFEVYNGATLIVSRVIDSEVKAIILLNYKTVDINIKIVNSGTYNDGTTSITLTPQDTLAFYIDRTNNKAIILSKVLTP